ncbi:MAG: putative integral rane protein [Jatrophihabitans sp.]|jgi:hypothetical protein|nr:putative integral rane protein [Jatrophihabitans sp.]
MNGSLLRRNRAGSLGLLVTVLLVAGGGVAIGHAMADSGATPRNTDSAALPAVSKNTLGAPHGPTRMSGELPVGFTNDKGGALSCAAVAAETLIDYVQVRRTTPATDWTATYTTGELSAPSMQKILDWNPAVYRLGPSDRPTQLAPRRHAISVSELVPVGFKILAFSPAAAHVQVWLHGAGWSQGSHFPNTVVDRSADIALVWRAGDWKIISYTQPSGQTWEGPALDDPAGNGFAPWPGGQFTFVTG